MSKNIEIFQSSMPEGASQKLPEGNVPSWLTKQSYRYYDKMNKCRSEEESLKMTIEKITRIKDITFSNYQDIEMKYNVRLVIHEYIEKKVKNIVNRENSFNLIYESDSKISESINLLLYVNGDYKRYVHIIKYVNKEIKDLEDNEVNNNEVNNDNNNGYNNNINEFNINNLNNYNDEQKEFIMNNEANVLIGIPGGGKTRSIIEKIHYLNITGKISKPHDVLVVMFSNVAKEDFLIKSAKHEYLKVINSNNVRTIHSISGSLYKRSKSIKTCVLSALKELKSKGIIKNANVSKLKYIFVDEAQDISKIQYSLMKEISKITGSKLILIGDPDQNIYQFQDGSNEYLKNHDKNDELDRKIKLIQNYRSTNQIIEFVNHFRPSGDEMIGSRRCDGKKPIIICGNYDYIISNIINEIENYDGKLEDIAIIGPVKVAKNGQMGLQEVSNALQLKKIKCKIHYKVESKDQKTISKFMKESGKVNFLTIHNSKGLEFNKVILLNFHKSSMGLSIDKLTKESYDNLKYLWYVAMSRAIDELSIYSYQSTPIWSELKKCPPECYIIQGNEPKYCNKPFSNNDGRLFKYDITDIVYGNVLDVEKMHTFENMLKCDVSQTKLCGWVINPKPAEEEIYSAIHGRFMERIFNHYYQINNGHRKYLPHHIQNKLICIPKRFTKNAARFLNLGAHIDVKEIHSNRSKYNKGELSIYEFICKRISKHTKTVKFIIENDKCVIDEDLVEYLMKNINNEIDTDKNIFKLEMYNYQIEYDAKFLFLSCDYDYHIEILRHDINNIKQFVKHLDNNLKLQVSCTHSTLPLNGRIDILSDNKIVDIKYTSKFEYSYVLQLFLYYDSLFKDWITDIDLEIWNFKTGMRHIISITPKVTNIELLEFLSKSLGINH